MPDYRSRIFKSHREFARDFLTLLFKGKACSATYEWQLEWDME